MANGYFQAKENHNLPFSRKCATAPQHITNRVFSNLFLCRIFSFYFDACTNKHSKNILCYHSKTNSENTKLAARYAKRAIETKKKHNSNKIISHFSLHGISVQSILQSNYIFFFFLFLCCIYVRQQNVYNLINFSLSFVRDVKCIGIENGKQRQANQVPFQRINRFRVHGIARARAFRQW